MEQDNKATDVSKATEVKVNSWWKSSTEFLSRYQFVWGVLLGSLTTVAGYTVYSSCSSKNSDSPRKDCVL